MTPRPARLAAIPEPAPAPEPWLTLDQLATIKQVSRDSIERDVAAGCPCIDVAHHHPLRRKKRMLRFLLSEVRAWHEAQERGR